MGEGMLQLSGYLKVVGFASMVKVYNRQCTRC